MTRLQITHRTAYRHAAPIAFGPHRLMLRPRETRDLRLVAFDLTVVPAATVTWAHDVSGNAVATARFAGLSDSLTIESRMTVETGAPAWPVFDIALEALTYPFAYAPEDATDLGALALPQYVDTARRLETWARGFVMGPGTDTLSLLKDLSLGVSAAVAYQSREVEGTQGPLETLDRGWGSCRDFAVLFAEAARTLGFGARIVSGYLHGGAGGIVGSAGQGSTHAWVDVFLPGAGWIAFDPTNRSVGAANLIHVAVARHISQVVPVAGSFLGTAGNAPVLDVAITVAAV